ncbi:MAG: ATP-binding cassette domain-containing protein, partial [Fimbriimonadaceae bacterium]|nr:ATP-binding cassette domain-containing protein [Fimbriimonadaceae bacterium]
PVILVEGLTHRFGPQTVLKDISFEVEKGTILAILGTSGGGKTTLLRCLAGLLIASEGKVQVAGLDVRHQPEEARSKMGFVFQYSALFDSLTVEENVLFGVSRQRRIGRKEGTLLATQILENVGLHDVLKKKPAELSGGMRKRVGLARALALEPDVLFYDEPTSGLDPVTAYTIDRLIVETGLRTGATSVVVTHDVGSVHRIADEVLFLHKGEMAYWGDAEGFWKADHEGVRMFLAPGDTTEAIQTEAVPSKERQ